MEQMASEMQIRVMTKADIIARISLLQKLGGHEDSPMYTEELEGLYRTLDKMLEMEEE